MSFAACYLSPEGVIFGADSAATQTTLTGTDRHYNSAQKIFRIGDSASTFGVVGWGMGSLGELSHRTFIARFADELKVAPATTVREVAARFADQFWNEYSTRFSADLLRAQLLESIPNRSQIEENEWRKLQSDRSGGFFLGGYIPIDRTPAAFEILYDPCLLATPIPRHLPFGRPEFQGWTNVARRTILGIDPILLTEIAASPFWTGTAQEMYNLVEKAVLAPRAILPIGDAIDWIHSLVDVTIKTMKFSQLESICAGPIELAVVTTDGLFQWVRHKPLGLAIEQGGGNDD